MPFSDLDLARAMATARRAAEAGGAAALAHFATGVRVETKPDRSPVTAADREAEAAILKVIGEQFPDHAILAEETGAHEGSAASRWIVDPLDGTRGFTRGGPFWGPLVALEQEGEIVAGAMALPAIGEVYCAARGHGTWLKARDATPKKLQVSGVAAWEDATLSLGELHLLLRGELAAPVGALATSCAQSRCYGDLAGCAMVLTGRAEAWIEAGVKIWDLAPLKILVEEAGGRFTDLSGAPTHASGECIASNGLVHDHVLASVAIVRPPGAARK
jgi:histidinol-phosphatase